ncbi:MAG: hypothetical protein UX85_C0001G0033 [Candidatus Beckwithbacteria bacterium GW2011_GWB1_47_15]|uniref:Peptidase C39-like domain-containing protein n=1 Tax=Candidatus Beckwithbacteria bacterium GW2011_GWB1_47_15 TaxID=1618371 RepID=A0A0G1RWW9_9BACT|nr:MAG: hypothetical protein UY43_C0001G1096 [Candidatus Beckwithbacteria bacterium GW2011_GWC1_49_16]AQS30667.1 hypothetical protein [uncultured bacterium]KKU35855.1 MAG: hypothetical protein UX50_C0001G0032 [Candidatus Beckwithbacteria bacterium GW2011_GWA1_46_30]KKU61819.1 MAG: hypothetical protein UX85_C0001G0033 [Candidatus Beckwithbacteria bacterium GW2011_GWB1_47_15]KKU72627.1 MAG: hypothetical protein UX97_C0001G0497 [Candidatus Beckwithbacteria bacterium GW2011_GWA2_47_25]KKW04205.1 M
MSQIPFYPNSKDNTSCYPACLRMVLKHFLPAKNFSMKSLNKIVAKKKGLWTWPMHGLISLKKMGFDIEYYEDFDYLKFAQEGEKYLIKKYGKKVGQAQIDNSDITYERKAAAHFTKTFKFYQKAPTLKDLKRLIRKGYLAGCSCNYYALYDKKGYSGHFVLVFDINDKHVYFHDPGRPARPNQKRTLKQFINAWAYPDKNATSIQAFKL